MGSLLLKSFTGLAVVLSALLWWRGGATVRSVERECSHVRVSAASAEPGAPVAAAVTAAQLPDVLLRLATSENGVVLCSLLDDLPESDAVEVTYATSDVLARSRLRSVRACAARALARQKNAEAQSFLVDLAEDADADVQQVALEALLERETELARVTVIEAAHSDDLRVRFSAVLALLRAKRAEAFSLAEELLPLLDDAAQASEVAVALGESKDPRALSALLGLMERGHREARSGAIAGLGKLGAKEAIATLESLLSLGSEDEFRAAATALAELDRGRAVNELIQLTRADNGARRGLAVGALAGLAEEPAARLALLELANSDEEALANEARRALGALHDPRAEAILLRAAQFGSTRARGVAIRALAALATPTAAAALKALTSSDEERLRREALFALLDMKSDDPTVRGLRLELTADPEFGFGPAALDHLAQDRSPEAQAALVSYLERPGTDVDSFTRSIPQVSPETAAQLLARHGNGVDAAVRRAVILGVAQRPEPGFVPVLEAALRDDDGELRRAAAHGLVMTHAAGADALLDSLLRSNDSEDVALGVSLLGERGDAASLDRLQVLAKNSVVDVSPDEIPEARAASSAFDVLKSVAPERAASLIETLFDPSVTAPSVKLLGAAGGLDELALPTCLKALSSRDPEVLNEAITLASQLRHGELGPKLLSVARDAGLSQELRAQASELLLSMGGELARSNAAFLRSLQAEAVTDEESCRWERR